MNRAITMTGRQKIKVGIVANEFFDLRLGRMGGLGWAARQVATCFNEDPAQGVEVVYISGEPKARDGQKEMIVHGTRLLLREYNSPRYLARLCAEKLDLLLFIDYRPSYRFFSRVLPRTPILVWVRDPRLPDDIAKVNTIRIPGAGDLRPSGLEPIDCTSLTGVVGMSKWFARPIIFASPAPHLIDKVPGTYGVQVSDLPLLPNLIDLSPGTVVKSQHPRVLFLGRLDPIKRPWLYVELAREFPSVEFLMLGKTTMKGPGSWQPENLPANLKLMGHIDGQEKKEILISSWVLVNTSISEGLAVSFLEALACETPILSCVNPGNVVSNYGIYVGRFDYDGLESLPGFTEGLRQLLSDRERRVQIGRAGREWVEATHSRARFLEEFNRLCERIGLSRQSS